MENLKKKNEIIFCFNFILKVLFIFKKGGGGKNFNKMFNLF